MRTTGTSFVFVSSQSFLGEMAKSLAASRGRKSIGSSTWPRASDSFRCSSFVLFMVGWRGHGLTSPTREAVP